MGRFLTLGAFILLAVLVIAATIPSFIDWQSYREPIERAASDTVGRDVKITGSVGFTILPYPSVELGGVTVANKQDGISANLLTLETLSAKLALAPLLRGALKVETFEVEGADLALERTGDGVNWTFAQTSEDGTSSGGGIEALLIRAIRDISIEDFSAKDVKVSYTDTLSGQTFDWDVKHGQASLASMNGPFEAEGRVVLGEEAFYVTGKIGVSRPDRPRPVMIDALTADGLSLKFDGAADRTSGALVIKGRTEITAPKAHQLGVPFAAITGTDRGAWAGTNTLDLPGKLVGQLAASAGAIKGSEIEIELGGAKGLAEIDLEIGAAVTGAIRIESKSLDIDELTKALTPGTPSKDNEGLDVDVEIQVETRAGTFRETRIDDVSLAIRLMKSGPILSSFKSVLPGQSRVIYALRDGSRDRGNLTFETDNAREFLTWMGLKLDGSRSRAFRTLNVSGDVIFSDTEIKLTGFEAALDGVKIEGALVRTRTERPSLGANLKILGLDLERFGTGSSVEAWIDHMSAFDMNAILKLRQFTGFNLERRSVDLKAQMVRGTLTVEDVQVYGTPDIRFRGKLAKDDNGHLTGKMRVDAKELALCSLVQSRSEVIVPGCAENPLFKSTAKFTVAAGKVSGDVVGTSKKLAYEGTLSGIESVFEETFGLNFDGKGEIGKASYKVAGGATNVTGETVAIVKLDTQAPQLEVLLETFDGMKPWAKTLLGLVEGEGETKLGANVTVRPKVVTFEDLDFRVGPASVIGSGTVASGDDGQVLDLSLTGQNLALLKAHGKSGWSTKKLNFTLPKDVSGQFAMLLTDTLLAGIPVSSASLKGVLKSGGLELDVGEASAFGGVWEGDVTLREGKGGILVASEGKARDLDLAEFFKASLGVNGFTGEGDLSFSVSADGRSWKSLVENSAGMIDLKAWKGTIDGFDLPGFSAGLKDASGELGARLVVEGALSKGTTEYTNLEAEMTLADGKLRIISLVGELESGSLTGNGEINLADLTVKGLTSVDLVGHKDLPKIQNALTGALKKPRSIWDAEEMVLKFTEAWLLANQSTEMGELPGAEGSGVMSEELDDLAAPNGP